MTYKYNVSIEQPMCKTWEIEAETLEEAEAIAKEKYLRADDGFVMYGDDTGTDALIMVSTEDESESIDWHDM